MEKRNINLNVVFMTLTEIFEALKNGDIIPCTQHIVICNKDEASALDDIICIRSHIDAVVVGDSFRIVSDYHYGFDLEAGDSTFELDMYSIRNTDAEIKFMVVDFSEQEFSDEPAPPPAEKVTEIVLPDVTAISSDDLLKVVANYDTIHTAAIKEMNKRLYPVSNKLGVTVGE